MGVVVWKSGHAKPQSHTCLWTRRSVSRKLGFFLQGFVWASLVHISVRLAALFLQRNN
jgi:hypothetical protein